MALTKKTDHLTKTLHGLNLDLLKRLDLLGEINNLAQLEAVCLLSYSYDSWLCLKDPDISNEERERVSETIHQLYLKIPDGELLGEVDLAVVILRPAIEEVDFFAAYTRYVATGIPPSKAKDYVINNILTHFGRMDLSLFAFELSPNLEKELNTLKNRDWDKVGEQGLNTRILDAALGYASGSLSVRKSRKSS